MRKSRRFLAGLLMLALAITTLIPSAIPAQAATSVLVTLASSQPNLGISGSGNSYSITYNATAAAASTTTAPRVNLDISGLIATETTGSGYQATIEFTGGAKITWPTTGTATEAYFTQQIQLPALSAGSAIATVTDLGTSTDAVRVINFTYTPPAATIPLMKDYGSAISVQPSGNASYGSSFTTSGTTSIINLSYNYNYYYGITNGCSLVYAFTPADMTTGGAITAITGATSNVAGPTYTFTGSYVAVSIPYTALTAQTITIPVTYTVNGSSLPKTQSVQINFTTSQTGFQQQNWNQNYLTMSMSQNPTTAYVGETVTLTGSLVYYYDNYNYYNNYSQYSDYCVYSPYYADGYTYHFYNNAQIYTANGWVNYSIQAGYNVELSTTRTTQIYGWNNYSGYPYGNTSYAANIPISFTSSDTANVTLQSAGTQSASFKASKAGTYTVYLTIPDGYQLSNADATTSGYGSYLSNYCVYTPGYVSVDGYSYHYYNPQNGTIYTSTGWTPYNMNEQYYASSTLTSNQIFGSGYNTGVGTYGRTKAYTITVLDKTGSSGSTSGNDVVIVDDNADGTLKKGSRVGLPMKKPLPITNASGSSLGTLSTGFVIITGEKTSGNRLPISYNGGTAYVAAPYVNVLSGTLEADAKIMQCTAKNYVSLRASASGSATRLEKITANQLVIAYPSITSGAYIKVMYNGKTGWAESKYLKDY